jgi:prepilin-type processing-associated H-X9-DG protein
MLQYTQDYDERLPVRAFGQMNWMTNIQPYLKSEQVFSCPSDTNNSNTSQAAGYWPTGATPFRTSYLYNRNLSPGGTSVGLLVAAITNSSKTVIVTDGGGLPDATKPAPEWTVKPIAWLLDDVSDQPFVTGNAGGNDDHYAGPLARHLETTNVLWVDGHVKSQKVPTFYSTSTTAVSPCLQPDQTVTACP